MNQRTPSRRYFLAGATAAMLPAATALTAGEIVLRIQRELGIPWRAQTVDRLVAGTAETPVRGIATTMMATLDVVRRSASAGCNLVITHEPTFYTHQDKTDTLTDDPVYRAKLDFLQAHNMAVFHFHDHWHGRKPDGINEGMTHALGWEAHADPAAPKQFTFPPTPLAAFARQIQHKLNIRVMRVIGDPALPIRRVIVSWGNVSLPPGIPLISLPGVDALICGETHEWELVEYVQDMMALGQKKALVLLGHVVSEQAGMQNCASWLTRFVPEVPVKFIPAAEPYWNPAEC